VVVSLGLHVGVRNTGSVDKNVKLAVVVDDVLDGLAHSTTVADIDTVESDVDAGLLAELASSLVSQLLLHIHDGDTADTDLSECLCHVETETTTSTSHDGDLAGQCEFVQGRGELAVNLRLERNRNLDLICALGIHGAR